MNKLVPSDTRTPADLILFAMGFVGFWLGAAGIVIGSVGCALTGVVLFLIALFGFFIKGE
jgi:hypothetical protein